MNTRLKFVLVLLALSLCGPAAAQGMYKCKDAAGKITYSGNGCNLIGLTSAGEVTGRVVVTPALKPPDPRYGQPAAQPSTQPVATRSAAAPPPAEPEKRCFTIKTAKGTSTRCNDTPDDPAAATK